MVRPEWVVEISCLDLVSQTTRGSAINRMVLDWNQDGSDKYQIIRRMPLVSVISPQFIRRRDDKSASKHDVRIEQVTQIVDVPEATRDAHEFTLPKSEILRREVYTKEAQGETMVRKFVLWKTNKEGHEDYPAYVLHFTDFSPNRKNPLAREVRVSDSEQQILDLWNELKEANIKRGWNEHHAKVEVPAKQPMVVEAPPVTVAEVPKPAAKKKAARKAGALAAKAKKKAAGKMAKSAKEATEKVAKKTRKKSG
jgi:hypothetical protein